MPEAQIHFEPLDQGLVTSQDQATLDPGELARADNVVYLPSDPSLHKVKGRTKFNTVAISGAGTVKGLRYLAFDGADNLLVAHTSSQYDYAVMNNTETGTFASLATGVGSGNTLDAIQYNNRHYLLNGADTNRVVIEGATSRLHGLSPVTDAAVTAGVTGHWNSALGTGYFFFITTEVLNPGPGEVESTNTVRAELIPFFQITSGNITTTTIQITRPGGSGSTSTINPTATHWRVYMAGPFTGTTPVPPMNLFKLVAEQSIANTTALVGDTTPTGPRFPTATSVLTSGWASPTNAFANDNVSMTTSTSGAAQLFTTFGFTGLSGTVTGIAVNVKVRVGNQNVATSSRMTMAINLTINNGSSYLSPRTVDLYAVPFTTPVSYDTRLFGSNSDLWGRTSWVVGDITSANFGVSITVNRYGSFPMAQVQVDYISVTVYTTSNSAATGVSFGSSFRTISLSVAGITVIEGANGPPPVATTGDIFEAQMVTNDVSDLSIIRYSLPDEVDYFPSRYFINFETKQTDIVRLIKHVGNVLIVGMRSMCFRVNYLPRESDAEFDRGRCYEVLSEGHGIVGPQAAVTITLPGGSSAFAFVSYAGIHMTDGFQVETLTDDIDWQTAIRLPSASDGTDYLQNSILVDYPVNYQLWFYFTAPSQTTNTKALVLHYHPTHRKQNGKFKITGPIDVTASSATLGRVSGNPVLMTGQSGGFAYVEDRGYTDASGGSINVDVRTRELYLGGMGGTVVGERTWVRHDADPTSTVSLKPILREADSAQDSSTTAQTFSTANAGLAELPWLFYCESMQWQFTEPSGGSGMRLASISIDHAVHGRTEPR